MLEETQKQPNSAQNEPDISTKEEAPKEPADGGIKIFGLKEETKRMHEEHKDSPKIMHDSSLKAPTRNKNSKHDGL